MPGINITGATSKATQAGSLVDAARLQANVDQSKVPPGAPGSEGGAAAQAMTASFQVFNQMLDALNKIAGSTATTAKNTEARTATAASAGPTPKPVPVPPGGTPASFDAAVAKLEREMAADAARQQNRRATLINASADEARKADEKKAREQRAIQVTDANKMNRDFDRAKAGGGGSGFGGGGIGRGGAQYGRSFLSATGMGAAGGMGLGVVESGLAGNPIAMMAETALAFAAAPQIMGAVVGAFNSYTKPHQDFLQGTYRLGRTNGVSGESLKNYLYTGDANDGGHARIVPWMEELNIGNEDSLKILQTIGPAGYRNTFDAGMLVRKMADLQLGPGFSNIDGGAAQYGKFLLNTGLAGPADAFGAGSTAAQLTGGAKGGAQMDVVLARAVRMGLDGADVLKNMEQGIVTMSKYTGLPDQKDASDFLEKFLLNGGTYGRSGAMGLEALQGTQQAALNLGATPLGQMLQGTELKIASSREGLVELMGGGTSAERIETGKRKLAAFESTAAGKELVKEYLDSRARGMMGPAERQAIATITAGTNGVSNEYAAKQAGLGGAFATKLGWTMFGANVTGQTPLEYMTPNKTDAQERMGEVGASEAPGGGRLTGPGLPRGIRNNNPGNLNFADQPGAVREEGHGGREAKFPTMAAGVAALQDNLRAYQTQHGINTLRGIITRWSPPNENDTEKLIAEAEKRMEKGRDEPLDLNDPVIMQKLTNSFIVAENGGQYSGLAQVAGGGASRVPTEVAHMHAMGEAAKLDAAGTTFKEFKGFVDGANSALMSFRGMLDDMMRMWAANKAYMRNPNSASPNAPPMPGSSPGFSMMN